MNNYDKSKPAFDLIAVNNLSFNIFLLLYVGNFNMLKHVDAVGNRESSLHSTL
jgi:hypothetical protein